MSAARRRRAPPRPGRARLVALLLAALAAAACGAESSDGALTLEQALAADWSALEIRTVTRMPEDEPGGRLIVFLHGYGSRGDDLVALAEALLDARTRVLLPTAALPHPSGRGAMWWEFLDEDWPKPYPAHAPWPASRQLPRARAGVERVLARARERHRPDALMIAGHSQGAMLALDVATAGREPVDRVAAVAGYALLDSLPNLERPGAGRPPVFVAHGRRDPIVAFDAALALRGLLEQHGFPVRFLAHDGEHGIPEPVVRGLRGFLLE